MSSWRNRLARSTVNREVAGSIPAEDANSFPKSSNLDLKVGSEKIII